MIRFKRTSHHRLFARMGPLDPQHPVLIAVPHAGRDYPPHLLSRLRVSPLALMRLEDRYADLLAGRAAAAGFSVIMATRPRAWIDLNRSPQEMDAGMIEGAGLRADGSANDSAAPDPILAPSAKTRGGLGLVPRRLAGYGELWDGPFTAADIASRVKDDHAPYHEAIARMLAVMRERFGVAVLLDLHSMPPLSRSEAGGAPPSWVVGDRHGRSCTARLSDAARAQLEHHGPAALNHPYAGGYVLARHGRPEQGVHAVQIELDRACYLSNGLTEPGPGLPDCQVAVLGLARRLADEAQAGLTAIAAE